MFTTFPTENKESNTFYRDARPTAALNSPTDGNILSKSPMLGGRLNSPTDDTNLFSNYPGPDAKVTKTTQQAINYYKKLETGCYNCNK